MSFMKRGKEAQEMTQKNAADQERRRNESGNRVFRFYMPDGAEQQITFLDGELNDQGILDVPTWWEHQVKIGKSWRNWFPCVKDEEPCPLCEDKAPSLVYALTIIDHSEWKDSNGKEHAHERKLFVCKGDTYKRLTKQAQKHGGLTGCTFDVARMGDKAENVGNDFDFVSKSSLKKLAKKYDMEKKGEAGNNNVAAPYDYEEVIKYYTAAQLRDMGIVDGDGPVGSEDTKKSKKSKSKDKKKKDKKKGKKGKKKDFNKDL